MAENIILFDLYDINIKLTLKKINFFVRRVRLRTKGMNAFSFNALFVTFKSEQEKVFIYRVKNLILIQLSFLYILLYHKYYACYYSHSFAYSKIVSC